MALSSAKDRSANMSQQCLKCGNLNMPGAELCAGCNSILFEQAKYLARNAADNGENALQKMKSTQTWLYLSLAFVFVSISFGVYMVSRGPAKSDALIQAEKEAKLAESDKDRMAPCMSIPGVEKPICKTPEPSRAPDANTYQLNTSVLEAEGKKAHEKMTQDMKAHENMINDMKTRPMTSRNCSPTGEIGSGGVTMVKCV